METPEAIPQTAIKDQLTKILASKAFARSHRLRRFLSFTVEQVLAGRGGQIKEYLVGMEVFDKKQGYDPRTDPVVRVEAYRLRARLDFYYRGEGREDPILISFPKGAYVPVFRRREQNPEPAARIRPPRQPPESKAIGALPLGALPEPRVG